jgi:hypothetical protein
MSNAEDDIDTRLEAIAREHLGIETLAQRNADGLDFYDVAVWAVRSALLDAYREGYRDGAADCSGRTRRARTQADTQGQ